MGRVNNTRKNVARRNKDNVAKRYEVQPASLVSIDTDTGIHEESGVMLLPNDGVTVPSTSEPGTSCSNNENEVPNKPTDFALYNNYKTEVTFDDNAPNYIL
ncbi:hypothetical protein J6590_030270 [Homalodisca vitripennis]|nr:hypothetical protein J6590_030270 [Homalodisca vitripennis]